MQQGRQSGCISARTQPKIQNKQPINSKQQARPRTEKQPTAKTTNKKQRGERLWYTTAAATASASATATAAAAAAAAAAELRLLPLLPPAPAPAQPPLIPHDCNCFQHCCCCCKAASTSTSFGPSKMRTHTHTQHTARPSSNHHVKANRQTSNHDTPRCCSESQGHAPGPAIWQDVPATEWAQPDGGQSHGPRR